MPNRNTTVSVSGGIGLTGVLTIVFVVLKILDKIDWSWWWVFSPVWISCGSTVVLVAIFLVAYIFLEAFARS